MKKMYIVKYSTGDYEDCTEYNVFVTADRGLASDYVVKARRILIRARQHYRDMRREVGNNFNPLHRDHIDMIVRLNKLDNYNDHFVEEIEVR